MGAAQDKAKELTDNLNELYEAEYILKFPEFVDLFLEVDKVFKFGAAKHGDLNFTELDGTGCSKSAMMGSMSRHLAEWYCGHLEDKDSNLHPLAHLVARVLITYHRQLQGFND